MASEAEEEPEGALGAASVESPQPKLRYFAIGRSSSGRSAVDADAILAEGFGRV